MKYKNIQENINDNDEIIRYMNIKIYVNKKKFIKKKVIKLVLVKIYLLLEKVNESTNEKAENV